MRVIQMSILIFVTVVAIFLLNEVTKKDYSHLEKLKQNYQTERYVQYKRVAYSDEFSFGKGDSSIRVVNSI